MGNTRRLLRRLIGEDIELEVRLAPGVATVYVDPAQIEQVIVNLAVNARDAMPGGGTLTIETANVTLDAGDVSAHAGVRPGRFAMIAMRDTGHGFAPEVRARLFEPFFTTRPRGKGTGLGLATCYGIVQQSGGFIRADGEAGHGATFTAYLPHAVVPAGAGARAEPAAVRGGTETVLLVEDEAAVRSVASRILSGAGYRVLTAQDGAEALRLLDTWHRTVDVLVTDVVMPEMAGPELARHVRERYPAMRVLFTSGYAEETIAHHGVLDPGLAFLAKPYPPADLMRKVREVLDRR